MKLLLLSDTHGEYERTLEVIKKHRDVDQCIHMGDVGFPRSLLKNAIVVCGNHDHHAYPSKAILNLNGYRTLVIHGDCFEYALVKRLQEDETLWQSWDACLAIMMEAMIAYAKAEHFDMILFGHTHTAYFAKQDGIYLCNPGSLCFAHDERSPSYAIMNIDTDIQVEFYFIDNENGD